MSSMSSHRSGNTRLAVATLMAVSVLLACAAGPGLGGPPAPPGPPVPPDSVKACSNNGKCLFYSTWAQKIEDAINGQAVGYAFRIVRNGTLTSEGHAYGYARTAADPPQTAMSLAKPYNVASVNKTLTAVAVLHLLAAEHVSVTASIEPYLPKWWHLGPFVRYITFEELLTQTSGIQTSNVQVPPNTAEDSEIFLKAVMAQPIIPWYKHGCKVDYQARLQGEHYVACYNNANFALFRIIIPYLWHYGNPYYPDLISLLNLRPDQYDNALDNVTQSDYLAYLKSLYGPSIPISCTPTPQASDSTRMLAYIYPGTTPGWDWGDWQATCGGGGLQLSADQMATFLAHLASGAYLPLTASCDPDTTTLCAMVDNLYGWDWQYTQIASGGLCVQKNGALGNMATPTQPAVQAVRTVIVFCLQTGLAFAGLANSVLGPSQGFWDSMVETAYDASWQ